MTRRRVLSRRHLGAGLVALTLIATIVTGQLISDSQAARQVLITERFAARHTTATRFIEAYVAQIQAHQRALPIEQARDRLHLAADLVSGKDLEYRRLGGAFLTHWRLRR